MAKVPTKQKLTVEQVKQKLQKLSGERGTWENHWQEVSDYIVTRKNTILNKKSEGQKRTWQLLDNTGMFSNELLAGMLHGLLTNPNSEWFELTTGNYQLDQNDNVRKWLQATAKQMHNVLNNSNFQTEIHEVYIDLPAFGTACMLIEEDDETVVRFSTKFIAEYFIKENHLGEVDEIYREWEWTASQIVAEFGDKNLSKRVRDSYTKCTDEKFKMIHAVYPKRIVDSKYKGSMPFVSHYIIKDEDHEIQVGQFENFPYVTPRWTKAAGETYGRGPGMSALPELKVLNKMNETMLIGAQKMVDPPVQMEDDGVILPLITRPGGINYRRPGTAEIKPLFNMTQIDFGYQAMEDRRKRVRDCYYVDQLRLQQGGPMMTATEVLQRTEESTRLMGPMLGRQQNELLAPMIARVYSILWRRGLIAPPPEELKGAKMSVRYSSLIAKSQRVTDGQSVLRYVQALAPFINLDPSVADNLNGDEAAKVLATVYGPPQQIIADTKLRDGKRQQRAAVAQAQAQAAQQQNQMNQMQQMVETNKVANE